MASRNKTTFAKLSRETKVREKREASIRRKEQRQRDRDGGIEIEHEVEDLSHLDVAVVEGVEPDISVKRYRTVAPTTTAKAEAATAPTTPVRLRSSTTTSTT